MNTIISAVICTHNRQAFIEKAVQSLLDQTLDKNLYEIIVVDNNSNDNTAAIMKKIRAEQQNVTYIFEKNLGLSFARNAGWKNARGKYTRPGGWTKLYIDLKI